MTDINTASIAELTQVVRRVLARLHEGQFGAAGPVNQSRPLADPQHQIASSILSLYHTSRLVIGTITGTVPVAACYRVQLEKAAPPILAYPTTIGSCDSMSMRQLDTYTAGTTVVCLLHPQTTIGFILCALPQLNLADTTASTSILFGASRQRVDDAYYHPLRMHRNGLVADYLSGRPMDGTTVGEHGAIHASGARIFSDAFMATLGIDEMTGVTAFVHDQLLRIAGVNLQLWSACSERESYDDQGEAMDWTGYAAFPWEQLGQLAAGAAGRVLSAQEWQKDQPHYGKVEPNSDWAMPWHREREFHGYLGQGGKRIVQGLPQQAPVYGGAPGWAPPVAVGFFDESITQDGRWLVQFAKGATLIKRQVIVAPNRARRPEQGSQMGDDETNYRASGHTGGGPTHKITGDIATQGDYPQVNRAAGILDLHAYFLNYAGLHPFHYHAKDYYVPQEEEVAGGVSHAIPSFSGLGVEQFIDTEKFKTQVPVDHRYGDTTIYGLPAAVDFLDDGGLVLTGGGGCSITMTGGNITLAAPGDIWLKSGRNVNTWAGNDYCLRVKHAADISVTEEDLRVKTGQNMLFVAAEGGVLIESQSTKDQLNFPDVGQASFGGIVLRATQSNVVSLGWNIYQRVGGDGFRDGGSIFLDTYGLAPIFLHGSQIVSYATTSVVQHFGDATIGDIQFSNSFSATSADFCGNVRVGGGLVVGSGGATIFGNVEVPGGHIYTEQAVGTPQVAALVQPILADRYGRVADAVDAGRKINPKLGFNTLQISINQVYYAEGQPGETSTIERASFSFRDTDGYRARDFVIPEDHWQQLARISGQQVATWDERPVVWRGKDSYPYPGTDAFHGTVFMTQDVTLFDAAAQRSLDRGAAPDVAGPYQSPAFAAPQRKRLDQYSVII
jgi:hypothetical protein